MKDELFYMRSFLNKEGYHSTGMVLARVSADTESIDADLILMDCSRQIALDFYCYNKEDIENARLKLKTIRSALDGFEKAFEKSVHVFENYPKKKKRKANRG
jgi:hypothetical protein